MDGYVRFYTDENGKFTDYEELWGKSDYAEREISDCIDCLLENFRFKPNSLILIAFNLNEHQSYDYYGGGYEYDIELEIENQIILVENYEPEEYTIEENEVWEDVFNTAFHNS